jgi:hypothetical protein
VCCCHKLSTSNVLYPASCFSYPNCSTAAPRPWAAVLPHHGGPARLTIPCTDLPLMQCRDLTRTRCCSTGCTVRPREKQQQDQQLLKHSLTEAPPHHLPASTPMLPLYIVRDDGTSIPVPAATAAVHRFTTPQPSKQPLTRPSNLQGALPLSSNSPYMAPPQSAQGRT